MKKIIVLLIMLMLVSVVHAGTVTRSVEPATIQPGDEVTVTLSVVALDEDLTYVIRENVPAGWEFVSASFQKKYFRAWLGYL